jgi:hypothetical protein
MGARLLLLYGTRDGPIAFNPRVSLAAHPFGHDILATTGSHINIILSKDLRHVTIN